MSFGLSRGKPLITDGYGYESADFSPFDDPDRAIIDPRAWFDHPEHPLELEIGSGKGTFLVQSATSMIDRNFLGIEWTGEFYRFAADRIRRHGLENVRMLRGDACEFIRFRCPPAIADVIHLYFSDPWPKKRHHKRRVIQDETLRAFHRVLLPEGELRIVTDHVDLWEWMVEHAERHRDLFERRPFQSPDPAGQGEIVGTNFERKYRREGRPFQAMTLRRREES